MEVEEVDMGDIESKCGMQEIVYHLNTVQPSIKQYDFK